MATGTNAVVNRRSETWEGAAGWAWHFGSEKGAQKQGLSPPITVLWRWGWGEEMGTVVEGQDQSGTLRGRKESRIGRRSCSRQPCLQSLEGLTPSSLIPHCLPAGKRAGSATLSSLLGPGSQTATSAAGGPCTCSCVLAHSIFTQVLF